MDRSMQEKKTHVPYQKIPSVLGIRRGDFVIIASDITRLAMVSKRKEGSFVADKFIDSFQKQVGREGTLMIPSFNFNLRSGDEFSPVTTPPTTGALSLLAFHRSDFVRTRNPLHSFMVWGRMAGKLASLQNLSSFGKDSPFAVMKDCHAKMVFIGVKPADALTFTHYVEEDAGVTYRKYKNIRIRYFDEQNLSASKDFLLYAKRRGWTMRPDRLQQLLKQDLLKTRQINGIYASVLPLDKTYNLIYNDIRENNAKNIAAFDPGIFFKDLMKEILYTFKGFRTTGDKIKYGQNSHTRG